MLSNPHWDAPSFSSFEAWLETKDPAEKYPFCNIAGCACAQYLRAVGKWDMNWLTVPRESVLSVLNTLASDSSSKHSGRPDYTFGGLLARVRKYRQEALAAQEVLA